MKSIFCYISDTGYNMMHYAVQEGHTQVLVIENWISLSDKESQIEKCFIFCSSINPHPAVVTLCSSFGNRTAGKLPSPNDLSGLGPSASKSKGKSKRSVVNKSTPLLSGCFETCWQTLRGCTIFSITRKTIRGWKGLE